MEIITYIQILRYRKREIILTVLLTFLVTVFGRALVPVKYTSSAILRVVPYTTDNPSFTQLSYATRIMKTYVEIGSSSIIMTNLREELGLTPTQPVSVEIEIIPDTELLQVSVTDYDPVLASDVANALAGQLINDNSIRDVRVTLIEPASIPKPPSMVRVVSLYVLGLLIGLLGGFGLVFFLENIDPRVYTEKQAENISKLQVLGHIPPLPLWRRGRLIANRYPFSHAFRRLAINLVEGKKRQKKKLHTIMITSPEPGEGKSLVAANLAYSLANADCKVLLVDLNLHHPTLHRYFGLPNNTGLNHILFFDASLNDVVQKRDLPGLSVITSGTAHKGLEEVFFHEEKMKKLLAQLNGQYDYAILDTPAFLGLVDSMTLSSLVDGILLVTRLGITRADALAATIRQLEIVQTTVLGLIVNHVSTSHSLDYYHFTSQPRLLFSKVKERFLNISRQDHYKVRSGERE